MCARVSRAYLLFSMEVCNLSVTVWKLVPRSKEVVADNARSPHLRIRWVVHG